ASVGDALAQTSGAQCYTYSDGVAEVYKRLVVSADGKKLLGAILVGEAEAYGTLQQLCVNNMDLPTSPEQFILPQSEGAGPAMGVDALPDTAQLCSCYDVTKGAVRAAVQDGCTDMGGIKS